MKNDAAFQLAVAITRLEKQVASLEKIVFLLLDHLRDDIGTSYRLDRLDKQNIADWYDVKRSEGE